MLHFSESRLYRIWLSLSLYRYWPFLLLLNNIGVDQVSRRGYGLSLGRGVRQALYFTFANLFFFKRFIYWHNWWWDNALLTELTFLDLVGKSFIWYLSNLVTLGSLLALELFTNVPSFFIALYFIELVKLFKAKPFYVFYLPFLEPIFLIFSYSEILFWFLESQLLGPLNLALPILIKFEDLLLIFCQAIAGQAFI